MLYIAIFPCGYDRLSFFNINLFNWRLITLQYCIGFAIHQHESATGIQGEGSNIIWIPKALFFPSAHCIYLSQSQSLC